jgi:hypothetical protein
MGDVFINYDEYGKRYLKRMIYLNVLLYIIMGFAFLFFIADVLIILLIAVLTTAASLVYSLYFIRKNPPREYP